MGSFSISNIFYWYWFLISKRTVEFVNFIIVMFIFPILPYMIVAFKLINDTKEHKHAFYGDGSLLILCSGILCSFVAMLFEHKTEEEKNLNSLINSILIILFIIITLIFIDAQLTFNRDCSYIKNIMIFTTIITIITLLSSLYLNFRLKINYPDVERFIEEIKIKKLEKKVRKSEKSKGGTRV